MGKMGFHFHRHGHHGHKSALFHGPNKWSRWMACSGKGQGPTELDTRGHKNNNCSEHHNHHPNKFQKRCSGDWKRNFHHCHHGHGHHSHQNHSHRHGHHTHFHCHGHHQSCSQKNVDKQPMGHAPGHSRKCCSLECQTKACQTDAVQDEVPQSDCSIDTETEAAPVST